MTARQVLAPLALALCSCATWTVPQPMLHTAQLGSAWGRLRAAVEQSCGGVELEDERSRVVISRWRRWPGKDATYLTRCMASVLPEDGDEGTVRLTLVAQRCLGDLPAQFDVKHPAPGTRCEEAEVIPEAVKDGLEQLSAQFEKTVVR